MKLRWILLPMLQLIVPHTAGLASAAQRAAPVWSVDPAVPGPDMPGAGASLFDRVTIGSDGRQKIPFPFERLMNRIEAAAGCTASQPCTRAVLIPLGRSLQRAAASPDFYRHPRVVAAVVGDADGFMLRDRLFLGFQERTGVVEVISYNETLGRFEFQVVNNYRSGATPEVTYARRTVCIACHQNHGPIFSQQMWLETNANPQIATRLQREQPAFYGVAARVTTDVSQAIDDSTDRANRLALTQRLWNEGCGTGVQGDDCRRATLNAALQFALTGHRSYAAKGAFEGSVSRVVAANAVSQWAGGIALPDPTIPNRDPLDVLQGINGAGQANVEVRFDPLVPRPPREILVSDGRALSDQLVMGVASFWPERSRTLFERTMQMHGAHASLRRLKIPCSVVSRDGAEQFECAAPDASVRLRGSWSRTNGTIDELGMGDDEPVRYLRIELEEKQIAGDTTVARLRVRDRSQVARLPDGNEIAAVSLRWQNQGSQTGNGEATLTIRDDFSALSTVVSTLPLNREVIDSSVIDALMRRDSEGVRLSARAAAPLAKADSYAAIAADGHSPTRMFESQCGRCHHTNELTPPNFLSGDTTRVAAAIESCAPRIFVRLSMRDMAPAQRAKSPMPPERFSLSQEAQETADIERLAELRAMVGTMLVKQYGRLPTMDELLRPGYESLPSCLPST